MDDKKKVVFVCTHNAGKSRLAQAYLQQIGGDRFEVLSGGTEPSVSANPAAVEAAREVGLDLATGAGKKVTPEMTSDAVVVTFGCQVDGLPDEVEVEDWALTDEAGSPIKDYGAIRDAIMERVDELAERLDG